VVPLTVTPANSEELVGGAGTQPVHSDATANRVLVKGEPVPAPPGRADDFVWPPGSDAKAAVPAASVPAAPAAAVVAPAPHAVVRTESIVVVRPPEEAKKGTGAKVLQTTPAKPKLEQRVETKRAPQTGVPRPPADIPQSRSSGWFR
jgi:hypothetical protein